MKGPLTRENIRDGGPFLMGNRTFVTPTDGKRPEWGDGKPLCPGHFWPLTTPAQEAGVSRQRMAAWLTAAGIPHFIPAALSSELYADASHPLGPGYAAIAEKLLADASFAEFRENATREREE